jgi:LAGLIDADG endonuclease
VTQHIRDAELLKELISSFNCGYYKVSTNKGGDFIVTRFSDISTKIVPFFEKYPILGSKSKDFYDFVKVAELIQNKAHLTADGFEQIKQIKSGMNRGRKYNIYPFNNLLSSGLCIARVGQRYNQRMNNNLGTTLRIGNRYYTQNCSSENLFNE